MGRPTDLTPELQARIVAKIQRGVYPMVAAGACGTGRTTFKTWMNRGKSDADADAMYRAFRAAVKLAMDEAESAKVLVIDEAAATTWQAAAWWLERCRHKRYARRLDESDRGKIADSVAEQFRKDAEKGKPK